MKKRLAGLAGIFALLNCGRERSTPADGAAQSATHNSTSIAIGGVPNPMSSNGRDAGFDSVIPPNMREALYSLAPDFRPYRRDQFAPEFARTDSASGPYGLSVVRARLNADTVPDVALLGSGRVLSYFIALLSTPEGAYQAMHVEPPRSLGPKDTAGRGIFIERQPRGRIDLYAQTELGRYLTLRSDGVILQIGREGAILYFLKDGKFVNVGYGD